MTWAKLDDSFPDHPKIDRLSDGAFRLHVTALCWSCRWLTDGFIPADRVRSLPGYRYKASHVTELVVSPAESRACWVKVDGGYQIHDFAVYQQPAEKVRADREAAAERMRKRRTKQPRSPEQAANVRQNSDRSSGAVPVGFGDPVPGPVPVRTPPPSSSSPPSPPTGPEEDPRIDDACRILATHALNHREGKPVNDPAGWLDVVAQDRRAQQGARAVELLEENPTLDARQLAAALRAPTTRPGYVVAAPVALPDIDDEEHTRGRTAISEVRQLLPASRKEAT